MLRFLQKLSSRARVTRYIFEAITRPRSIFRACVMDGCVLHTILRAMIPKSRILKIFVSGRFFHSRSQIITFCVQCCLIAILVLWMIDDLYLYLHMHVRASLGGMNYQLTAVHVSCTATDLIHTAHAWASQLAHIGINYNLLVKTI